MRTAPLFGLLAVMATSSLLAPSDVSAAPLPHHRDDGGGCGDRCPRDSTWRFHRRWDRGDREVIIIRERRVPRVIRITVPVPVLHPIVLSALDQVFPLQPNLYAVSPPGLFCGIDQLATCQPIAEQLSQITPGWGVAIMDGPQGYGAYLTCRSSAL